MIYLDDDKYYFKECYNRKIQKEYIDKLVEDLKDDEDMDIMKKNIIIEYLLLQIEEDD